MSDAGLKFSALDGANQLFRVHSTSGTTILSTQDAASVSSASLTTLGGLGITKKSIFGDTVSLQSQAHFTSASFALPSIGARSAGTRLVLYPDITPSTTDIAIGAGTGVLWSSVRDASDKFSWYNGDVETLSVSLSSTFLSTVDSGSTTSGSLSVRGGVGVSKNLYVGGTLNVDTLAVYNATGLAAPSTTTRSVGTRVVINPALSSTSVDYAIGTETSALWMSVPTSGSFKMYSGTSAVTTLDTTALRVLNTTASTNAASGALVVSGGVGCAGSLNVAATLRGLYWSVKGFGNTILEPALPNLVFTFSTGSGTTNGRYCSGRITAILSRTVANVSYLELDYYGVIATSSFILRNTRVINSSPLNWSTTVSSTSTTITITVAGNYSTDINAVYYVVVEHKGLGTLVSLSEDSTVVKTFEY